MQTILNTLVEERGEACMEYLRDMDDDTAKQELSRFKAGQSPHAYIHAVFKRLDSHMLSVTTS